MRGDGIADASFHPHQHTAAAWMVQADRSLYEVQRILGHSTPVMTQRYADLEPKHLPDAVDALDSAIRGVDTKMDTQAKTSNAPESTSAASANLSGAFVNVGR